MNKKVVGVILLVLALIVGGIYGFTQFPVNDESRAGILVKFGEPGVMFKTYEGQINQIGLGQDAKLGLINNLWDFSVKDKAVAQQLQALVGKNVNLHYKQINHSFFWQGKTNYFVYQVEEVKQ